MTKPVPFLDLRRLHAAMEADLRAAINMVMTHGQFINGPEVGDFEQQWAVYTGTKAAIGCANGTNALHAIFATLGIGPGDEVVLPSHTFVATAESIRLTGATPVFAEIDEATMLVDPASIEASITPRTRAIVPVHLYGMPAPMDEINRIASHHGLAVVEDAAQAHGAVYRKQKAGSLATAASFSFFPGKNLGALGDAGAVTTGDGDLARKIRLYVNHGRESKYEHQVMGTNYRLDTLQAAVLLAKLPRLDEWTDQRRKLAFLYREFLRQEPFLSMPVNLQEIPDGSHSSWHLFVISIPGVDRARLMDILRNHGIGTGIHYPIPCHLQPSMADVSPGPGALPITEKIADSIISLPMCPTMNSSDIDTVCSALGKALKEAAR